MRSSLMLLAAVALVAGCGKEPTPEVGDNEARLRNAPPTACTDEALGLCPAPAIVACPAGTEAVLDYSSDCCAHFSCQPVCVASKPCSLAPAPICPAGTQLWIGTALEDCCPAYRCEPVAKCDELERPILCTLAMPYCGDGVMPIIVGETDDCCPIYQCPCDKPTSDGTMCGCTYPNCLPGEQMACDGQDRCGGPCYCKPNPNQCGTSPTDCPPGTKCDNGTCVPFSAGCSVDSDCPRSQRCEVVCSSLACLVDPCPCEPCACIPEAEDCPCLVDSCQTCVGKCVPREVCDPAQAICPMWMPSCPNGVDPIKVGTDPTSCCPIWECPCVPESDRPSICPLLGIECKCPITKGTDPRTCCPVYECAQPNADGTCPAR